MTTVQRNGVIKVKLVNTRKPDNFLKTILIFLLLMLEIFIQLILMKFVSEKSLLR